jgi:hypothetical protein
MDQQKRKYNSENRLLRFIWQDRHLAMAEWMQSLNVLLQKRGGVKHGGEGRREFITYLCVKLP